MAELNVGTLEVTITADGTAAVQEFDRVRGAAESAAGSLNGGFGGAEASLQGVSSAAGSAAGAMSEAGAAGEGAGRRITASLKGVGELMGKVGKAATAALTVPIVGALTAAVKGASDLTETLGKTEVVFGDMNDRVLDWASTSVEAMGLAQGSALDYASTYGDMATGMGLSIDKAAEMSMNLTQLAADMASFKNISTEVAAQKLNSVFTGETEALKQLGIVMTQANLDAFAMSQGITTAVSKMSQQEQVMLRYQYVMAQTKNAQGDFARTGDSLANQSRKLGETVKQLGESFGSLLMPAVTGIVERLQGFVQHIAQLDSGAKSLILTVAMAVAAVGPALLIGSKVISMITAIRTALAALSLNPVIVALAAVAALGAAFVGFSSAMRKGQEEVITAEEAYNRLYNRAQSGIDTEVNVDTTDIDDINGKEYLVYLQGDGQKVLEKASEIVGKLKLSAYEGKITLDGSPQKAYDKIAEIEKDLETARQLIIDGKTKEAADAIDGLQTHIDALEGMVVVEMDPGKAIQIRTELNTLKLQLSTLTGEVKLSAKGAEALGAAQAVVDELNSGKYVGKLTIDGDPEKAEAVIAKIDEDLKTAHEMIMSGDPEKVNEAIATLKGDLALLGEIEITDDPAATAALRALITELQGQLDGLSVEVAITASGQQALDKAQEIVDDIEQNYSGKMEIDGNPKKAEAVIAGIDKELETARDMILNGNAEGAAKAIEGIDALLAEAKNITITDDPVATAALRALIASLDQEVNGIKGSITFTVVNQDQQALDAFTEQLAKLPKDEHFRAFGEFTLSEGTKDNVQEYLELVTSAVGALGDYKAAVEDMNSMVDAQLNEDIKEVNKQATEQAQTLTALYKQGGMTSEEYSEALTKLNDDREAQIKQLQGDAETQKKMNEVFADGSKSNDIAGQRAILEHQYDTGKISKDLTLQGNSAMQTMDQTEDISGMKTEGQLAKAGMVQEAVAEYEQLASAVGEYETAVASADQTSAEAAENQKAADAYGQMSEAIDIYQGSLAAGLDAETAWNNAVQQMGENADPSAMAVMTDLLHDETGALVDGATAMDAYGEARESQQALTEKSTELEGQAAEMRKTANEALQESLQGIMDQNLGSEAAEGALIKIDATGVDISGAEAALITGVPAAVESAMAAASAAVASGENPMDALAAAVGAAAGTVETATNTAVTTATSGAAAKAKSEARKIGTDLIAGAKSGVSARASQLAREAAEAVRKAIAAAKAAAESKSPSKAMAREVGVPLMQGAAVGVQRETPNTLRAVRRSVGRLITGASDIVKNTVIANPAAVPAMPGIDYAEMGSAMSSAMGRVNFRFGVGERDLATATREQNAGQIAFRSKQINRGYGLR